MTIQAKRTAADYSLLDPAVQSAPYEFYDVLREEAPVYQVPENGMFVVTRYEDVRTVLLDTETFSSDFDFVEEMLGERDRHYNGVIARDGWAFVSGLQRSDPPIHSRHRAVVDEIFNIRRVKALVPRITRLADALIDAFIDRGECDFIEEFALPFPGTIIAEQLGLGSGDLKTFKAWSNASKAPLQRALTDEQLAEAARQVVEMQKFLEQRVEERRREPRDDLISVLVNTQTGDGEPLSMHELQAILRQLMTGGFDTVTNSLANGLWLLLRYPDQLAKLRARPELVNGFIEEALRFETPVQGLLRRTTRDVEMAGTTIPKGAIVIPRYGAANRDPDKFACPHAFDIERKNASAHLGFGFGIHFCVGRPLARTELQIAFSRLIARLKDISLARPLPVPPHAPSLMFHPMAELKIRFQGG